MNPLQQRSGRAGFSTPLIIAIVAIVVVASLSLFYFTKNPTEAPLVNSGRTINKNARAVVCSDDAKVCPDGSTVSRTGPNCEFTECPVVANTNSTNINSTVEQSAAPAAKPLVGGQTYANTTHKFSFRYPTSFGTFTSTANDKGYRGKGVVGATNTEGTISITVLDKKYDPKTIEGLFGPVEAQHIKKVNVGSQAGSMFMDGDAGCAAQEALAALNATQTLWISFSDCIQDINATESLFYDDLDLIRSILATFTFTS